MKSNFRSLPLAIKLIVSDPINLILTLVPTLIALAIYVFGIVAIFKNSDILVVYLREYIHAPDTANLVGKILTALLIIFVFVLMSWTFVILVNLISAPFNSLLSDRIEKKLVERVVEENKSKTFKIFMAGIGKTFINEFKKLVFILLLSGLAFVLNLFPLFYPIGLVLVALLIAIQFVDYSWSRHEWTFQICLKDVLSNFFAYVLGGLFFLLLITIPLINTLVPALATSYFTVLWLHRQKKIPQASLPQ